MLRDITERKQAKEALRESEERYRSILNASPDGITITDLEGRVLGASPAGLAMFGWDREDELLGHLVTDSIVPEDRDRAMSDVALIFQGTTPGLGEYCGLRTDGSTFDIEVNAAFIRDAEGQPARMVFITRDVTERKQVEQELSRVEEYFRATFEHADVGIAHVGTDGTWLRVNQHLCDMLGYTREELLHITFFDITHPDYVAENVKQLRMLLAGDKETYEAEKRYLRKDGSLVWANLSVALIRDEDGAPDYFVSVLTDITERKRAEKELRESEERYRLLLENANDAVYVHEVSADTPGRFIDANRRASQMLGYSREEFLAMEVSAIDVPEQTVHAPAIVAQLVATGSARFETEHLAKNGERVPVEISVVLFDLHGTPTVLSIVRDITERKQAEDETQQLKSELEERVRERTEELSVANEGLKAMNAELVEANARLDEATHAKSDFLASMSHELRTPLNSIIGFSGTMLQGLAGDLNSEQDKQLGMINNSGRHLLELINEVLDLAKVESVQNRPRIRSVDVGAIASEMFDTVRPMAEAKGIELRWTCPEDLRPIRTDRLRVSQILLNLMGNAVKFTEHGSVSATVSQDDSGVTVAVEDSGRGIAAEDLKRVFDDFYQVTPHSTARSEGTGLGLAVSRRLAESIGARIELTSEPGRGSAFTLRIPERLRERDLPVGQSYIEL